MNNNAPINLPPFRLYGLIGCPHCADAERFLRGHNIPADLIICNGDPIIQAGVTKVVGEDAYPILLCRQDMRIIKGFKAEEYDRLVQDYYTSASASAVSVFGSGQQPDAKAAPPTTENTPGVN